MPNKNMGATRRLGNVCVRVRVCVGGGGGGGGGECGGAAAGESSARRTWHSLDSAWYV